MTPHPSSLAEVRWRRVRSPPWAKMRTMDHDGEAIRAALANDLTIDIVTVGARSGLLRTTEIWFLQLDGRIIITGTPGRRDWLANLKANPEFTFRLKESMQVDLPARARLVTDPEDRRAILEAAAARWYREQSDIEHLVESAPLVEVTLLELD